MKGNQEYIEERLLALLLKDISVIITAVDVVQEKWFTSSEHKFLYSLITKHFKEYGALLSFESVLKYMKEYKATEAEIENLRNVYLYITGFKVDKSEFDFLKTRLFETWQTREILKEIDRFVTEYEKGNYSVLKQFVNKLVLVDMENVSHTYVNRGEFIESFVERKNLLEEKRKNPTKYKGILTGIEKLDELTGGLWKGEVGCVFGKTMIGKSTLVLSFAKEAFFNSYRVLYIVEEMPLQQVMSRFDASFSRLEYRKFKEPWFLSEGEQKRWEYRIEELKKYYEQGARLYIHHIPVNCSIDVIQREIEYVKTKEGRPPDLVIVDDLDMMTYSSKYSREEGMVMNARGLKSIAGKHNVAIWFTKQLAMSAYEKEILEIQDLAFAKGVVHQSDMVVGLQQTAEDKNIGRVTLQIVKFRDGPVGKLIYLSPDLSRALIHVEEFSIQEVGEQKENSV